MEKNQFTSARRKYLIFRSVIQLCFERISFGAKRAFRFLAAFEFITFLVCAGSCGRERSSAGGTGKPVLVPLFTKISSGIAGKAPLWLSCASFGVWFGKGLVQTPIGRFGGEGRWGALSWLCVSWVRSNPSLSSAREGGWQRAPSAELVLLSLNSSFPKSLRVDGEVMGCGWTGAVQAQQPLQLVRESSRAGGVSLMLLRTNAAGWEEGNLGLPERFQVRTYYCLCSLSCFVTSHSAPFQSKDKLEEWKC